jgi:hypothetical protein
MQENQENLCWVIRWEDLPDKLSDKQKNMQATWDFINMCTVTSLHQKYNTPAENILILYYEDSLVNSVQRNAHC